MERLKEIRGGMVKKRTIKDRWVDLLTNFHFLGNLQFLK
jgi:hypothetical protein